MSYRATAALPYLDHQRAVTGLRGPLAKLAAEHGATPDWSTLRVAGPDEVIGARGAVWYEWTATVDGQGVPGAPGTTDVAQTARTEVRS